MVSVPPRRRPSAQLLAALAAVAVLAGCQSSGTVFPGPSTTSLKAAALTSSSAHYHGLEPKPPAPRPSFILTDTSGREFNFAAETGGRPTLLYFGYTNCPDECPTTMGDVGEALRAAKPAVASEVRVVFVTTDPKRDTGPALRKWLDHFDHGLSARFIGLRGSLAQIATAERMAGVPPSESVAKPGGGYAVNHASLLFAYAVDDLAHVVYPGGTTTGTYQSDLPELLKPQQPA